jgi:predicted nucleic acid-binding protein
MVEEVANSLWKAVKRNRISQKDAQEALQTLNDVNIQLVVVDWAQASEVLEIACKLGLTVYDAAYILLAHQTEACLVTADDKLYEKAKGQSQVLHLKDF